MTRILIYLLVAMTAIAGVQTLRLANAHRDAAKQQAVWAEAVSDLMRQTLADERQLNRESEAAADEMREATEAVVPEMEATTQAAAERVRTVIQRVEVPANCPTTLPAAVVAEGQAAVERARRAGQ